VNCQPPRFGGTGQSSAEGFASTSTVISSGKQRWRLQMSFVAWEASDDDEPRPAPPTPVLWNLQMSFVALGASHHDEPRPALPNPLLAPPTPVLWFDIPARSVRKPVAITGIYCPAHFVMRPITEGGGWDHSRPITSFTLNQLHQDRADVGITEITQRIWKMNNRTSLPPTSKLPTAQRLMASAVALASVRGEYLPALSAVNDSTEPQFVITAFQRGEASQHLTVEINLPRFNSPEALRRCWELHDQTTRRKKGLAFADRQRIATATGFAPNTVKEQLNIIYRKIKNGEWE